jgi:solute:Na+ symporter, SSS family
MSAHSGAINSLAAATVHDIYLPLTHRDANDPRTLKVAKLVSLAWGLLLLVIALLYKQQGTPVVVVALSIASFTYGALLGGFALGIMWARAQQRDAITGMAVGILVMSVVVFAKQLSVLWPALAPIGSIAWPWYVLIGTAVTVGVGIFTSLFPHGSARIGVDDSE